MKVNFYLDKPYNPEIKPEKIKLELNKVEGKKKNLATRFWNPSPTALYLFFTPDKSCRIKYRTNSEYYPKIGISKKRDLNQAPMEHWN